MRLTSVPTAGTQAESDTSAAAAGVAILLIEPDLATRQLYVRALRQHWRVTAVRTVAEALVLLQEGAAPQAVVVEPYAGASQIDWLLLSQLRTAAPHPPPVIVCSTLDERGRGLAWGATLYLVKPVSPQQLVAELSAVLA